MNFLAHLALAGPSDASRIGNILGDFEKGTEEALLERLPKEIVAGILMHRQIDLFTDRHPVFRQARLLLAPERRRFAGIIIDIYFDHFLSQHWSRYHPGTVTDFIQAVYQGFDRHPDWLGKEFGPLVPRLKRENWLASYASVEGLAQTLDRVANYSPRFAPVADAMPDLLEHRAPFEEHFLSFYPEARQHATSLLGKNSLSTPAFP